MSQFFAELMVFAILAALSIPTAIYVRNQLARAKIADKHSWDLSIFDRSHLPEMLSADYLNSAFDGLCDLVRKEKPDFIIGVHTGGRILSVLVCERLNLSPSSLRFISTDMQPGRQPYLVAATDSKKMSGKVLIIDDVTRTGSTLEIIRRQILSQMLSGESSIHSTVFAVLLVAAERVKLPNGFFVPDWWAYFTRKQDVDFPWSSLSEATRLAFSLKHDGRETDERVIRIHRELVTNYQFALFCAHLSIENKEQFKDMVRKGTLLRQYEVSLPQAHSESA